MEADLLALLKTKFKESIEREKNFQEELSKVKRQVQGIIDEEDRLVTNITGRLENSLGEVTLSRELLELNNKKIVVQKNCDSLLTILCELTKENQQLKAISQKNLKAIYSFRKFSITGEYALELKKDGDSYQRVISAVERNSKRSLSDIVVTNIFQVCNQNLLNKFKSRPDDKESIRGLFCRLNSFEDLCKIIKDGTPPTVVERTKTMVFYKNPFSGLEVSENVEILVLCRVRLGKVLLKGTRTQEDVVFTSVFDSEESSYTLAPVESGSFFPEFVLFFRKVMDHKSTLSAEYRTLKDTLLSKPQSLAS